MNEMGESSRTTSKPDRAGARSGSLLVELRGPTTWNMATGRCLNILSECHWKAFRFLPSLWLQTGVSGEIVFWCLSTGALHIGKGKCV